MKGEEGKGEKEGKSLRGERTGTPQRWPPTETSCSWRVYPHHYILARSHAARHSRIMSCFKKKKKKELFLLFFSSPSSSSLLLNLCVVTWKSRRRCAVNIQHADGRPTRSNNLTQIITVIHTPAHTVQQCLMALLSSENDFINKGFCP